MSTIRGNGAPTSTTKGGIGQVYIDTTKSEKYICVSSYSDTSGNRSYDWKPMLPRHIDIPEVTEVPEVVTDEEVIDTVEEAKPVQQDRPRNNYGKPYNKHQYNKPNRN